MAAILSSRQTFLLEVIPEVEYTIKMVISISAILSFWLDAWRLLGARQRSWWLGNGFLTARDLIFQSKTWKICYFAMQSAT